MHESYFEAQWYKKLADNVVQCELCHHFCRIPPSKTGRCGTRLNREGILYSLVARRLIAQHIDPIEKKPLYHFYPGSKSYSIATIGCNMTCLHCQNFEISQLHSDKNSEIQKSYSDPIEIIKEAASSKCQSISYTYTEPTIFFETVLETSKQAHEAGIKNCLVTNGYMGPKPLKDSARYIDAANVDLKSYSDDFYTRVCGARLKPVLENIKAMKKLGIWVEVTTLLIPTLNDKQEEMEKIACFLSDIGPDIPWHISRFYPTNKLRNLPPTPIKSIRKCREIGIKAGLKYVYSGNVPGDPGENTYCPKCGQIVIERFGYNIQRYRIKEGKCLICGATIAGIGM
ncbi:AmmeMemoRadiSam system radical SAM enzyme [bacterium]|nr:AmmeMemoRadiSam system radical SAM enzyme [bacterium]